MYNLLHLNLYLSCVEKFKVSALFESQDLTILESLEKMLYDRLDSSIRYYLQKRGVSIQTGVYTGFDTEYNQTDSVSTKLVSSQLAVVCKSKIQIPKVEMYKLSRLDTETNKLVMISKSSSGLNYNKVETSISKCIQAIRQIKCGKYDTMIKVFVESFKLVRGVSYYEGDDSVVFSLPRSIIQPYIKIDDKFSFKELLASSSAISQPVCQTQIDTIMEILHHASSKHLTFAEGQDRVIEVLYKVFESYDRVLKMESDVGQVASYLTPSTLPSALAEKSMRRVTKNLPERVSITLSKIYYVIGHLTQADLSQLSDFESIKDELSIVNNSFVTLGKGLKVGDKKVQVRDTMLLAPGGSKGLAKIGSMYPGFSKLQIKKEDLENMQGYLLRDKEGFVEYALRDAVITVVHSMWMEEFNFIIGGSGVPISLSSIGRRYVKSIWSDQKYPGYQISPKYLLGNVSRTITPKGLNVVREVGYVLPLYISNYKGGRNECFRYGIDKESIWYDYDLTSAYTTIMSMAGHPDYASLTRLSEGDLIKMSEEEVLYSYLIIRADFEFPSSVKYPSIPCSVNEVCTVYPLQGRCVITGSEYLLAKSQGCKFVFEDVYLIPFHKSEYKELKPFATVLKQVQEKRREYPKGTINNLMYKEIGNSIYGSVVRGIGDKRKFDIKSKGTVRMVGDDLTNPIIAS